MNKFILLDAGPLGMISHPRADRNRDILEWVVLMLQRGHRIAVPEIADYEIRRELIRSEKTLGLRRLDSLRNDLGFLPITSAAMLKAAELWAAARRKGKPTAADTELDADAILAAQALTAYLGDSDETLIATCNVKHLNQFTSAKLWNDIE
jgi:predicted nucleic acid-binding protein